ncbi:hypothetical protein ACIGKR_12030 [Rhodococcus qingshengii]|uniref:hypothetical protein n=1 Tax=Rhodococcus qingshengii TaxID=334542 RepID=UPI0037C9CA79
MARDRFARWWRHEVLVERKIGQGPRGPIYAPPEPLKTAIDDKARLVRDATGKEVLSSTTVAFPAGTAFIEPGSWVTLPAKYGGRRSKVIISTVADGGLLADHVQVSLE